MYLTPAAIYLIFIGTFLVMLLAMGFIVSVRKAESQPVVYHVPPSPLPADNMEEMLFRPAVKLKQAPLPPLADQPLTVPHMNNQEFKPSMKYRGDIAFIPVMKLQPTPVRQLVSHPVAAAHGNAKGFTPINGGRVAGKLCPVSRLPKAVCDCPDHKK